MALLPEFIKGTCNKMCPTQEETLRIKEKLLHFYEFNPLIGRDKYLPIKSFSRSAAGCKQPKPSDLRTLAALRKTVDYLLGNILLDTRRSYSFVYDFIFDRLRAIRQEIVMQNIDTQNTIKLLEPIVMFLAYSIYRLCEQTIDTFDSKICLQHLQECLKKLLCCYEDMDNLGDSVSDTGYNINNRIFIECIYLTLNLGNVETLIRAISTAKEIRFNNLFKICLSISINYFNLNFYRILHNMDKLPHILVGLVSLKLPQIRQQLFQQFSVTYKQLPLVWCQRVLIYSNEKELLTDCKSYQIDVDMSTKMINFVKGKFNLNSIVIKQRHENFVEESFAGRNISDIILML